MAVTVAVTETFRLVHPVDRASAAPMSDDAICLTLVLGLDR